MADFTRHELVEALRRSQQQVVALLESMADRQDWQPEPAEWSFRMLAAHLAAVERSCHLARVQAIATGNVPQLRLYAQTAPDLQQIDLRTSLRRWVGARQELLDFVQQCSDEALTWVGIHERVGPMTIPDTLRELLEQDQGNLRHVGQLIEAYYEAQAIPMTASYEAL